MIRPEKFLYSCVTLVFRLVVKHGEERGALFQKQ